MKLADALKIVHEPGRGGDPPLRVALACGFAPLHLETFLGAHLRRRLGGRAVEVETGLYGDLAGTLERLASTSATEVAVVVEWEDVDPRLGLRQLGGWEPRVLEEILRGLPGRLARLEAALEAVSRRASLGLALPTLPLPPVGSTEPGATSLFEAELRAQVDSLAARVLRKGAARVVSRAHLDRHSPPGARHAVTSDVLHGFPYTLAHASALAELLARLLAPPLPKKGLITDLDGTLWKGLLGEDGPEGLSWTIEGGGGMHGLYQQLLRALAEQGVLLAAATRNEPARVASFLAQAPLVLGGDRLSPVEAHWGAKSDSVSRILAAWNLGGEAVVFVDDSPLELDEVRSVHPEVECLLFPANDYEGAYALLLRLRELFGKAALSEEDHLRAASLRASRPTPEAASADAFLEGLEAKLAFSASKRPPARALELVNKTNQFNLNGRRFTEGEWHALLRRSDSFVLLAAYEDRYGPLGRIAVLAGRLEGSLARLDVWVMSCRAFSRRVEYACLARLFDGLGVAEVAFAFAATPRNQPLAECLAGLLGAPPEPGARLGRAAFQARRPPLFHAIREQADE